MNFQHKVLPSFGQKHHRTKIVLASLLLLFFFLVSCQEPPIQPIPEPQPIPQPQPEPQPVPEPEPEPLPVEQPITPTPIPLTDKGKLSISGRFYVDSNRNSKLDTTETPIANAQVELYRDVNSDGLKDAGDILREKVVTTTDGSYEFSELPAGVYLLVIPNTAPMDDYRLVAPSLISIVLSANFNQSNNHFGFTPYTGQSVFGHIYNDVNANSSFDAN